MTKRNVFWQRTVAKHGKPHVEILANWDTEIEAFDHEKLLIASFKDMGFKLVNLTDGGEGPSGSKHSEETKRKLSILKKGKPSPNKGVVMSEGQKLKIRLGNLGKPATRKGATHTDEAKAKMKGRKNSVETRNKMALSKTGENNPQFGKVLTEEVRKKLSESAKKYWQEKRIAGKNKENLACF